MASIYNLCYLIEYCTRKRQKIETLIRVRHLTRRGNEIPSFDLKDGFYAFGIAPEFRDYATVNVRDLLYCQWGGRSHLFTLTASRRPSCATFGHQGNHRAPPPPVSIAYRHDTTSKEATERSEGATVSRRFSFASPHRNKKHSKSATASTN
jgi:hypothetical protein